MEFMATLEFADHVKNSSGMEMLQGKFAGYLVFRNKGWC
jgi:hypothetical protein